MDPIDSSVAAPAPTVAGSPSEPVRCATFHAAQGVDPAGTASHWDAVLIVEVPGPWPRDISETVPFSNLADPPSSTVTGADGRIWRLQGVVPADVALGVRVMAHERPTGAVGPFDRREWFLPPGSLDLATQIGRALVGGNEEALLGFAGLRDDPNPATVDFLLCTHGTRDVCCGGPGTKLYREITDALVDESASTTGPCRVWRSSHEGGHRFAPTALTFPEGVSWAHLDLDAALKILSRDGHASDLGGHMKGAVSIERPEVQVADREGFVNHGWQWLAVPRSLSEIATDRETGLTRVEVVATLTGEGAVGVRSTVELAGRIPKPPCGVANPTNIPDEPVWRVVRTDLG